MKNLANILQQSINKCVDFVYKISDKQDKGQPISYYIRRELNEILETFYHTITSNILKEQEKAILKITFATGEFIIHEKLMHFGSFYYAKQTLIRKDLFEKEEILRRTNVESASMLSRIRSYQLGLDGIGGSTDDYFVERMPKLLDGISYVIDKNITEVFLPTIYNLLNVHQAIYYYINSGHSQYRPEIDKLLDKTKGLITKLYNTQHIGNLLQQNYSLSFFHKQFLFFTSKLEGTDFDSPIKIDEAFLKTTLEQKLRILINLGTLDEVAFLFYFQQVFAEVEGNNKLSIVETALVIRIISIYHHLQFQDPFDIAIDFKFRKIEISQYLHTYFNRIDDIGNVNVNSIELDLLYSYNDRQLREKLARCLSHIPANEIEREMKKPHGGFEISDMELKTKIDGHLCYLCMPFKTGQEIKTATVPVNIFYQILRPFFHFSRCVVVFISAKKCSQNLLNEIKLATNKYDFAIEVIEDLQLAQLLKLNNQLN